MDCNCGANQLTYYVTQYKKWSKKLTNRLCTKQYQILGQALSTVKTLTKWVVFVTLLLKQDVATGILFSSFAHWVGNYSTSATRAVKVLYRCAGQYKPLVQFSRSTKLAVLSLFQYTKYLLHFLTFFAEKCHFLYKVCTSYNMWSTIKRKTQMN